MIAKLACGRWGPSLLNFQREVLAAWPGSLLSVQMLQDV